MTETDKKSPQGTRISDKQRYRYIGFEVFPGKPKDLFKNQAEQEQLVERVVAKRSKGGLDLESCTLCEERVSFGEKLVLAVASLAMLAALLLPWFSVYTEVPAEPATTAQAPQPAAVVDDSLALMGAEGDSLAGSMADTGAIIAAADRQPETAAEDTAAVAGGEEAVPEEPLAEVFGGEAEPDEVVGIKRHAGERSNEEILTGYAIRRSVKKEYEHLSGLGAFASLGSVGSAVFSSGFVLIITGLLMLVYVLLCIGLPILNLYSLFGLKGPADDQAVKLKKYLRFNWLPIIILLVVVVLSFVGADYGFDITESFTSIGDSYDVGVLLGTLSWGVFVSMTASILVAVKGIEI